jgi:imidazolonepropionase-like amidohydrolase
MHYRFVSCSMRLIALLIVSLSAGCFACAQVADGQDLAILDAEVYSSPDAPPALETSILIQHGKITAVGKNLAIPAGIPTLSCSQCVIFAGFWNTHVHFMEPKWNDAAHLPASRLDEQMQQMLTHSGFATVVDTGSDTTNTVALRSRIESGELPGPHIYTAGLPLYPPHALPYYLSDLPPELRAQLGQPSTPAEAAAFVEHNFAQGTDIVKLFTGSIVAPDHVVPMSIPIARAAVEAAHHHGQLVFAHPTNREGIRVAMESGVDVLAHAADNVDGVNDAFLAQMVAHHMTMIPTLMLFSDESDIAQIRAIVSKFHKLGGTLMFGTDTGFLADYNLAKEYSQLALAGLTFRDVLAMLTTAPAKRFGLDDHEGRIAPGMNGDLTILAVDPARGDTVAFTHVLYTIRSGKIIYRHP